MPTYEYCSTDAGCSYCDGGFEVIQRITEASLSKCPVCGQSCRKVLSSFAVNASTKDTLSPGNLEKHGFTEYRRAGKGQYEKTAGKGPNHISGD